MNKALAALAASVLVSTVTLAAERDEPESGFGRLNHVFLIMMENQTSTDILGNANAPFINAYARQVNRATNYLAVGHPSAPNYLEIIGGSNFGVANDFWPNWVTAADAGGCVRPALSESRLRFDIQGHERHVRRLSRH